MKSRMKILAVDDDPVNIGMIMEILGEEYDVSLAASGDEALGPALALGAVANSLH